MATVCTIVLAQNGHGVSMWGANAHSIAALKETRENDRLLKGIKIPDCVRLTSNDADCFDKSTLIVSAVPTQYLRSVWNRLAEFAPANVPIVSVDGVDGPPFGECFGVQCVRQVFSRNPLNLPHLVPPDPTQNEQNDDQSQME